MKINTVQIAGMRADLREANHPKIDPPIAPTTS